ncbi:MAG: histidinol-phosphatase [Tannerella sp.]|jgi:histidinol-phosphatase (PHP family)|nr:histidinol-phosphatase [Tannerella sp.]
MRPSNFHSHCTFCDGRAEPEEFIRMALSRNFRAYGFSSHSPLPFETVWNMSVVDMPGYIGEINRLKQKYDGQIEIYLGLEIDYLDETYHASIPFFRSLPLDYRIGSLHFMPWRQPLTEANMSAVDCGYDEFRQMTHARYGGNIRLVTKDFFETSMRMIETGGFDIVGHADKIVMNGSRCPGFDLSADWYRQPFEALIDLIAEKGLIVEVNTKNFMRQQQSYPQVDALKLLYRHRTPVMVNSDCHAPEWINDGRDEMLVILRETGFRTTRELVAGVWQDVAID